MKGFLACALTTSILSAAPVMAGPYDGNWIGQIPPTGACSRMATMTITVSGTTVSGLMHNSPSNIRAFKGTIDADGNATFATQAGHPGTIKFSGEHFDANWSSGNCQRHSLGDRAPDAGQVAVMLTQRKQAQASYDDLAARAASGDRSVDFTVLRSSFPFTRQWEASDANTTRILEQAKVAANGKDCPTALQKLDEVVKSDFTLISAHRLRAECLKGDAARSESRIADALMHSLTHGADGRSENSAYPVMTMHEEEDLLADKHIVLKARDVDYAAATAATTTWSTEFPSPTASGCRTCTSMSAPKSPGGAAPLPPDRPRQPCNKSGAWRLSRGRRPVRCVPASRIPEPRPARAWPGTAAKSQCCAQHIRRTENPRA